jgi:hypothetical protein
MQAIICWMSIANPPQTVLMISKYDITTICGLFTISWYDSSDFIRSWEVVATMISGWIYLKVIQGMEQHLARGDDVLSLYCQNVSINTESNTTEHTWQPTVISRQNQNSSRRCDTIGRRIRVMWNCVVERYSTNCHNA